MEGEWAAAFSSAMRAASVAGLVYLLFAALKVVLGYLTGSIAVEADGIHTLSDFLTALVVYVGLRLASGRPTSAFPFGKYKAENLAALFVAISIGAAAVEVARESLVPGAQPPGDPTALVTLESASAVSYLALALYLRSSKGIVFSSLSAEAAHAVQDVLISASAIVGVVGQALGLWWVAAAVGLGISAFVLYQAYMIGRSSVLTLLDAGDPEAASRIEEIAKGVPGVIGVHEVRTRRAGPFLMASMHLETSPNLSVEEADAIADALEAELRRRIPDLLMVSIHEEPSRASERVAVFVDRQGMVADRVRDADGVLIVDPDGRTVEAPNPALSGPIRDAAYMLRRMNVGAIIVGGSGRERLLAFRALGMAIYVSPRVPAKEAVELLRRGELRRLVPEGADDLR